ncbi:MAG: hypothetical protein NVSMB51_04920 [Solirubrobacteraceae bacterium]
MGVIWHDLECGAYRADLALWHELAEQAGGPIVEIGAGTGRVALELAYAGHEVWALERDPGLAAELRRRARGLPLRTICADAQDWRTRVRFALMIVPMQTIHLLEDVPAFLRCARRAMRPGGTLAVALLGEGVEEFELELEADAREIDGVLYSSRPTAVRIDRGTVRLERRRERGGELVEVNVIALAPRSASELSREGFVLAGAPRRLAPTADHAGSEVAILHAA